MIPNQSIVVGRQLLGIVGLIFISLSYIEIIAENTRELRLIDVQKDRQVFEKVILPKYYPTVNQVKSKDDLDYKHLEFHFGNWSDYFFDEQIGSGASGTAFYGRKLSSKQKVVIKTFHDDTSNRKIKKELKLIYQVHDHPNIADVIDTIKDPETKFISIVYMYYESQWTSEIFAKLTERGNQYFLHQLLTALNYAHQNGIIHGDVKPMNMIVNPSTKMLKVIDWGLGAFYEPGKDQSFHIGTRSYKSPELWLQYTKYDYEVDIFAAGLIFSKMLFRKGPFFPKHMTDWNDRQHLDKLASVLGVEAFQKYIAKFNMKFDWSSLNIPDYRRRDFEEFINDENQQYCTPQAMDLLNQMLIVDHVILIIIICCQQTERITAKDALQHEYFKDIGLRG